MTTQPRTLVLFSGGDAPGMNSLMRALVRLAPNRQRDHILGARNGFQGLVRLNRAIDEGDRTLDSVRREIELHPGGLGLLRPDQQLVSLDPGSVCGLAGRSGIVLGAGRSPTFLDPAVRRSVIELLQSLGVTTLFVCGGNGTLAGAACLAAESSLRVIGIPVTVDNDVPATDLAIGVDTAVNTIVWVVERFTDTTSSHHRIMVLEVLGRASGELARMAALAAGAEIVVTPERGPLTAPKLAGIAARLETSMISGRRHGIVLVSEGVPGEGDSQERGTMSLANALEHHFRRPGSPLPETEVRVSVLGHLQRGGRPTAADRILAARFADAGWRVADDRYSKSRVLGLKHNQIALLPFSEVRRTDSQGYVFIERQDLYEIAKGVSRLA